MAQPTENATQTAKPTTAHPTELTTAAEGSASDEADEADPGETNHRLGVRPRH
jgi:hypothetical protein